MIIAPIVSIVWQDIVATETIKIIVGLTIGASLIFFRSLIHRILVKMAKSIKDTLETPKALLKAIKVLSSDEFQKIPEKVDDVKSSVAALDERLKKVEYRVGPNGGQSLLDGVNQLKLMVNSLNHHISSLAYSSQQIVDASDTLMFRLTSDGDFTWASKALQELVDFSFDDGFRNQQWENLYYPEDLQDVRRRWNAAIETSLDMDRNPDGIKEPQTILTLITKFRHNSTGQEIPVQIRLSKMPNGTISGIVNLINK